MIKKLIITSAVTVCALANTTPKNTDINITSAINSIIKEVSTNTKAKVKIENQQISKEGQSFDLVFGEKAKHTDKISSHSRVNKKSLDGLSFNTVIKHNKDSLTGTTILTAFPYNMSGKKIIMTKIIKDKVITLNYNYNINDYKYNIAFKDVNDVFDKGHITTKNIKLAGTFNPNDILTQESNLSIENIKLVPTLKKLAGQFVNLEKVALFSQYTPSNTKNINIKSDFFVQLAEANISKQHSILQNFRFKSTLGNVEKQSYLTLSKMFRANPKTKISDPKVIELITKLATSPNLYIAIDDLSVANLIVANQKLGKAKMSIKVSLENNPQLLQMIKISPLMALSALNVDAKISISEVMFNKLVQLNRRATMLKMIPAKKENGMLSYDISLKKGALLINGEVFPPKRKKLH